MNLGFSHEFFRRFSLSSGIFYFFNSALNFGRDPPQPFNGGLESIVHFFKTIFYPLLGHIRPFLLYFIFISFSLSFFLSFFFTFSFRCNFLIFLKKKKKKEAKVKKKKKREEAKTQIQEKRADM